MIWFLCQILQWNLSNYISVSKKILLQGLDPNLRGYQAALALYEKEAGAATKKGMPFWFFFLEHMLSQEFGIKA